MDENTLAVDLVRWSPNCWSGRRGHSPIAIINHYSQGDLESMINWFQNVKSQVSAHFAISKTGTIVQFVRTVDSAWANGLIEVSAQDTPLQWLRNAINSRINPNDITVSIEHEAVFKDWLTPAQFQSSVKVHRYLCRRWGIPPTREFIRGHNDITPISRANCPGYTFVFDEIIKELNK